MGYQLSTSELDPILAAIEERFEDSKPSALQVVASKLLLVATFGLVLTYVLYLTTGSALINVAWIWVALQVVLALLSWRYLPVVKRQRRLYRELELIDPDPTPGLIWKKRSANQQALARAAVGVVVVGIVGSILMNRQNLDLVELPPLIGMLVLIGASAFFVWSERKLPLQTAEKMLVWIRFGLLVWLAVLVMLIWQKGHWQDWFGTLLAVLWPAWLLVKSRQVARIQERFAPIARAGGLRESLLRRRREASESGSDMVSLDADDVAGLAYVESEIIRQDRVEAISDSRIEEPKRWAVFRSDVAREQLRALGPEERLAVQEAISALAAYAAVESLASDDPNRVLEVPGSSITVRYRLDGVERRVTVLELVSPEARSDG